MVVPKYKTNFVFIIKYCKLHLLHYIGVYSYLDIFLQICPTYPSAVVVPKSVDDETIVAAANFREGGRFPVLSYRHEGGVSICGINNLGKKVPVWKVTNKK